MHHTRRWPATLAVIAVLVLQLKLPSGMTAGPAWLLPACQAALLVPLVWANPMHLRRDEPWLRYVAIALVGFLIVVNAVNLVLLIDYLTQGTEGTSGRNLVQAALLIWVTNVVAFAIAYWEIDRGGAFARLPDHPHPEDRPDLLFPQMAGGIEGWDAKTWVPSFTDYVFVSFTNATAFSPTDTMPLSARLKIMMAVQAGIALLTLAVVAARAVNVL